VSKGKERAVLDSDDEVESERPRSKGQGKVSIPITRQIITSTYRCLITREKGVQAREKGVQANKYEVRGREKNLQTNEHEYMILKLKLKTKGQIQMRVGVWERKGRNRLVCFF
jgi:hypothetical protein